MEQVVQSFRRIDSKMRIPVLRLEIDYELMTLHDAMVVEDLSMMAQSIEKLELLRQDLMKLVTI
ncbi:hypothetical protein [Bacillus solitudinis]|uniref:hypothetical protein n=1 Tax=Bacillus solitudinis TaxID=2014074 RepID=UPI000C24ED72|nr:hypothetical protein [Bacillus solitudinis]